MFGVLPATYQSRPRGNSYAGLLRLYLLQSNLTLRLLAPLPSAPCKRQMGWIDHGTSKFIFLRGVGLYR